MPDGDLTLRHPRHDRLLLSANYRSVGCAAGAIAGTGIQMPLMNITIPEEPDEDHPGDESTDMGEIGDAAPVSAVSARRARRSR